MNSNNIIRSTEEQAVAAWIGYLHHIRVERLQDMLNIIMRQEGDNLKAALESINGALEDISKEVVNGDKIRGGLSGVHGYIAEAAEVGIGNARQQIEGAEPIYEWINDNGVDDIKKGATFFQMKFCASGNHLSLKAIEMHHEKYPEYLSQGKKYMIPADHYEKIKDLLSISKDEANKRATQTGEFSLSQWKEVNEYFNEGKGSIPLEDIEPSQLEYRDVQLGTYKDTFSKETDSLHDRNRERIEERSKEAYEDSTPTLGEAVKVTAVSAALEGAMSCGQAIIKIRKSGKKLGDFEESDWKEVFGETAMGTLKGGTRGITVFLLNNYTVTPAAVANAMVTASFSIAEQAHLYRRGELDEIGFIEKSEMVCMDAAVSAISSFVGQTMIPIPVLGAIIGNIAGTMMYNAAKEGLSDKEISFIRTYLDEISTIQNELEEKYNQYIIELTQGLRAYMELVDKAFDADVMVAFDGSIELAKEVGVPEDEILDSKEKISSYFLD